jgi:uncharacterized protein involved in outer membrane biogenesis
MEVSESNSRGGAVLRWLRSHLRALAIVAGLLLLYTLAGFLLVPRIARNQAISYVQHQLGRQLAIGSLTFNPFSLVVEIRDLAMTEADGAPIASFALLRIKFSATSSLLHRAWTFAEVRLEQPVINTLVNRDGSLNLAKLAPPAAPKPVAPEPASRQVPALRIGAFTVTRGQLHFEDRSRPAPFRATLSPIEFALTDFRTQPEFENRYRFSAATSAGEQLDWSGQFSVRPLGSSGDFTITALKASTIASYLEDALPFALSSGSIDLQGNYRLVAAGQTSLSLSLPSLKVHTLAIAPRGAPAASTDKPASGDKQTAGEPWIQLPEVDVTDTTIALSERQVAVGQVTLQNPSLQVWREADGSVNLQRLLQPAGASGHATASGVTATNSAPAPTVVATSATPAMSSTSVAGAAGSAPSWKITLAKLNIDGASIAAEDRSVKPALQLKIAPLKLAVQNYSSEGTQPISLQLDTGLGDAGRLHADGTLALSPLSAAIMLDLKDFELPPLQPYVSQQTNMTLYRGRLATQLQLAYAATPQKGQPQLKLSGGIQVTDLGTRDNATSTDFITWKALQVVGLRFQLAPDALDIDQVRTLGAYGRVIIGANGSLNVSEALRPAGAPAPTAAVAPGATATSGKTTKVAKADKTARSATPARSAPAATGPSQSTASSGASTGMPIHIKRVDVRDGAADFTDHSVEPNFSTSMLGLHGAVTGLSSDPASRAQVSLEGSVDRYAPVSIKGQLSPFSPATYTDISLDFKNIELTTFNPYSGKFAGYSIAQGKLSTELHYHIENRKLEASHHVVIDQLEFGAATESKQAVPLPVKLAAALLKDRNGVITLDLPVSGSIDDPTFKIGPIIWKLVVGLITKIVTAPFALLGSLFGGGPQLAYIDFPAGSAVLTDTESKKLPQLAKALVERPQVKLDIPLHTISASDDEALEKAALEQALAAAASPEGGKHKAAKASSGGSPSSPRLAALAALYRDKFKADPQYPADLGGAAAKPGAVNSDVAKPDSAKTDTAKPDAAKAGAAGQDVDAARIAWLEQELMQQFKPTRDDRDGLGRARAEAAQAALLANQELPAERVFLTERESGGGPEGQVRMELKLQ